MLTLGSTQTCCTESKFHAGVSEVKQFSGFLSAKPIISRRSVTQTVIYFWPTSGEQGRFRKY